MPHPNSEAALSRLTTYAALLALLLALPACFYVPPIVGPDEEVDSPPFVLGVDRVRLINLSENSDVRFDVVEIYDRNPPPDFISFEFSYDAAFEQRNAFFAPPEMADGRLEPSEAQTIDNLTTYPGVGTRVDFCSVTSNDDRPSAVRLVLTDLIPESQRGADPANPLTNVEAFEVEITWRLEFVGACPR